MDLVMAAVIGLLAGAHTSIWGLHEDSPHEGFARRKCLHSPLLSTLIAVCWGLSVGFDLGSAGSRLVPFGLVYVSERGLVELGPASLAAESTPDRGGK